MKQTSLRLLLPTIKIIRVRAYQNHLKVTKILKILRNKFCEYGPDILVIPSMTSITVRMFKSKERAWNVR